MELVQELKVKLDDFDQHHIFQFDSAYGSYPVFIKIKQELSQQGVSEMLESMHFHKVEQKQLMNYLEKATLREVRILSLEVAGARVYSQLNAPQESDMFGQESVIPRPGYFVYRYRGKALLVYALSYLQWELGVVKAMFSCGPEDMDAWKTILGRFLSWSLLPHDVVGFWGRPQREGLIVSSRGHSGVDWWFADLVKCQIWSSSEEYRAPLNPGELIFRPTSASGFNHGHLSQEELYCYLMEKNIYFHFKSRPDHLRVLLRKMVMMTRGKNLSPVRPKAVSLR